MDRSIHPVPERVSEVARVRPQAAPGEPPAIEELQDADVIRQNPRADVFKVERWEANPHRAKIDEALERAQQSHRLGSLNDVDAYSGTLGV